MMSRKLRQDLSVVLYSTNKTIRFPDDVIADVEAAIAGKDCTFSAFVIAAVRSALAQLAESPET